jgi:hypothetical protein
MAAARGDERAPIQIDARDEDEIAMLDVDTD